MKNMDIESTVNLLKRWMWLILPGVFFIELSHYFLIGNFKVAGRYLAAGAWHDFVFQFAILTILPALFVLISGALRVSTRVLIGLAFLGMAFSIFLVFIEVNGKWIDIFISAGAPLGVAVAGTAAYGYGRKIGEGSWQRLFFAVFGLNVLLAIGVASFLEITPALFPGTYDYVVHHIDGAFWHPANKLSSALAQYPEFFRNLLTFVYDLLGWVFLPLIALVVREGKAEALNVWRVYILALGIAMFCYAFVPLSGPLYAFGPKLFPDHMEGLVNLPTAVTAIQPAMRNGMPSMHFTSAVTIAFLCAALKSKGYFFAALLFVIGTIFATMGFGEHYLLDLVVALPYSVVLIVLLIAPQRYKDQGFWARLALYGAGCTFAAWMLLLKFQSSWMIASPHFIQGFALWSVLVFLVVAVAYLKSVWRLEPLATSTAIKKPLALSILPSDLKGNYWIIGVFFASGVAGLIYEVVFAKALAVTFGASSLATNTVLATYMGGMALGAWGGSRLAERSANPLRLYALCEAFIGVYALLTPTFFQFIQKIYVDLAWDRPADAPELTALRLALGAMVLGPATLAMGATFPIMFARLRQLGVASERAIAPLYAANVVGAAFGALFAGYALIPAVGKNSATFIAALLSLLIALYAIEKNKTQQITAVVKPALDTVVKKIEALPTSSIVGVAAVLILALGGAVTMGLEVIFMHMLAVVAGNSVYAFGLMLATFLLGLGLGSAVGEKLMVFLNRQNIVIAAQSGLAIVIVVSSLQWDALAAYFSYFGTYSTLGFHINFGGRELIRALVCAVAMIPAAFFIGMSYPACMSLATDWLGRGGKEVTGLGKASGINTLGNISGVLLAGFWLLPTIGSRNSLLVLTLAALGAAFAMMFANSLGLKNNSSKALPRFGGWIPIALAVLFLFLFPAKWDLDKLSEGSNVYFYPQKWGSVIDHAESTEGGLTTVNRGPDGLLTLLTNGKFQGNNSEQGEMVAQKSFALLPLLHTQNRNTALVIGYGTGMTPRVVHEHGFRSLDIAELSDDMVRLADKHFENINHGVTSKPGVSTYFTDGRNYLLTQSKKYDLISIEITSIWFAGAANLYNKEFYELIGKRLEDDGVLQQWIQLHHMQPLDFIYAMQSLRSSFRYVWFYVSGGQGIVIASNSPQAEPREAYKTILKNNLRDNSVSVEDLEKGLVAGPNQIDAMLSNLDPSMRALMSTDNNLYLEYATPKGNAVNYDTAPMIMRLLTAKYPTR